MGALSSRKSTRTTRILVSVILILIILSAGALAFDFAVDRRAADRAAVLNFSKQPIPSRNLTITILPLEPSDAVSTQLKADSPAAQTAAGLLGPDQLELLMANLAEQYPCTFEVADPLTIPDEFFSAERQQYNIDKLLTWMLRQRDDKSFKTIGALAADVYQPGYNFLFGLAKLGGPGCVASTARMGQSTEWARLMATERWHLIVRHELGHTMGLPHTEEKDSVMHYSNSMAELDRSSHELTRADRRRLRELLPVQWQSD